MFAPQLSQAGRLCAHILVSLLVFAYRGSRQWQEAPCLFFTAFNLLLTPGAQSLRPPRPTSLAPGQPDSPGECWRAGSITTLETAQSLLPQHPARPESATRGFILKHHTSKCGPSAHRS